MFLFKWYFLLKTTYFQYVFILFYLILNKTQLISFYTLIKMQQTKNYELMQIIVIGGFFVIIYNGIWGKQAPDRRQCIMCISKLNVRCKNAMLKMYRRQCADISRLTNGEILVLVFSRWLISILTRLCYQPNLIFYS